MLRAECSSRRPAGGHGGKIRLIFAAVMIAGPGEGGKCASRGPRSGRGPGGPGSGRRSVPARSAGSRCASAGLAARPCGARCRHGEHPPTSGGLSWAGSGRSDHESRTLTARFSWCWPTAVPSGRSHQFLAAAFILWFRAAADARRIPDRGRGLRRVTQDRSDGRALPCAAT